MRPLGRSLALLPLHAAVAATVCWPLPIRLGGALPGEVGPGLVRSVLHWRALVAGGAAELVQSGSVQQPFGVDLLARDGLPRGLRSRSGWRGWRQPWRGPRAVAVVSRRGRPA